LWLLEGRGVTSGPLVSILINNYNYGRFLTDAIDSGLNQTYRNLEVIVVDDGSTDDSREIIARYGNRITSVLKENGGQASALNAGVAASRGEIICLLDSDDSFDAHKVERVIPHCRPGTMLYHTLRLEPGADIFPAKVGPVNFYRFARQYRFVPYVGSPTSGLVLGRELALRLMPLPTQHVRSCADDFVVRGAALIGEVVGIPDVLGTYRVHGENAWYGMRAAKSPEFIEQLEIYLNQKLVEAGRAPVIDFYRSLFAEDFVPQNPVALTRLALTVLSHHFCFFTLKFTLRTLVEAGRLAVASR
jgi:glycosyltransferase involved in cell wall biosynthesis